MSKTALTIFLLFLILIPAQAVFFNNLVLFSVAVPLVFIYIIITLPVTINDSLALTIGFLAGLFVDILSDTPGINALACTLLTALRKPIFHLYVSSDIDLADQQPLPRTMGAGAFMKYAATMSLVYCALAFTIEAFNVFNFKLYVLRIMASSVFTFIIIYALAVLTNSPREKRL